MEHAPRRGRGRPALPGAQKKQQRNFRLSPEASDALADLAFESNSTETEALERAILDAHARRDGAAEGHTPKSE